MAKQINDFTTQHGVIIPQSYWKVMAVNLHAGLKKAEVLVQCFSSAQNKVKTPLDSRVYQVAQPDYDTFFGINVLDGATNPVKQAYALLMATKDCLLDGSKAKGTEPVEQRKSFFKDALDV